MAYSCGTVQFLWKEIARADTLILIGISVGEESGCLKNACVDPSNVAGLRVRRRSGDADGGGPRRHRSVAGEPSSLLAFLSCGDRGDVDGGAGAGGAGGNPGGGGGRLSVCAAAIHDYFP